MPHTDLIGSVYPNGAFKSLALTRIAALQGGARRDRNFMTRR